MNGFTTNVFNGQKLDNVAYDSARMGLTLRPVEGLTLGGNFAYTNAKFDNQTPSAVGNPCDPTQPTTIGFCSGNRFNSVPTFHYALNFEYALPRMFGVSLKYRFGSNAE